MKNFFQGGFLIAILIFPAQAVEAASLYIDPPASTLNRGDTQTLSIRLDTDELMDECINAVDGVVTYTGSIEPVDVSIGQSIFNVWVEPPTINKTNKTITFAGGIPNGYCGRVEGDPRLTNILVDIIFRSPGFVIGNSSPEDNEITVDFTEQTTAYLNDGRGTKAPLSKYPARITLSNQVGTSQVNEWQNIVNSDNVPPEEFSISLQKNPTAFSGKYYIVFNTSDKQTGIDQYQVMEDPLTNFGNFRWGRADVPWITTRSPYVLKDQSLNSTIYVKATDKAGNEYIATLVPEESQRTMSQDEMLFIVMAFGGMVLLMLCLGVAFWFFKRRNRKINTLAPLEQNNTQ